MQIILRLILGVFFIVIAFAVWPKANHSTVPVEQSSSVAVDRVKAGNFAPGQLQAHFAKHGYQFGTISEEEYLEDARKLLDAPVGNDLLEKVRPNGDIERYRPSTNEFSVMTRTGRIRTYFIANDRYWYKQ